MDVYKKFRVLYQFLLYFIFIESVFSSLSDVTSNVGLAGSSLGSLAAFGDFNSDKKADLFFINNAKGERPRMKCEVLI